MLRLSVLLVGLGQTAAVGAAALPDFDVRRGGVLTPAQAARPEAEADELRAPTPVQAAALATLEAELGPGLVARFGGRSILPRVLFHRQRPLAEPSRELPAAIARAFLRQHRGLFALDDPAIASLVLVRERTLTASGAHQLLFVQHHAGVPVYHAELRFVIAADGAVVWVSASEIQPGLPLEWTSRLTAVEAARAVLLALGPVPDDLAGMDGLLAADPTFVSAALAHPLRLRPVLFPARGAALAAWIAEVVRHGSAGTYSVVVEAKGGRLLARRQLTHDLATWPEPDAKTETVPGETGESVAGAAGDRTRLLRDAYFARIHAVEPAADGDAYAADRTCAERTLLTAVDHAAGALYRWRDGLVRAGLGEALEPSAMAAASAGNPPLHIELVPLAALPPRLLGPWNVTAHAIADRERAWSRAGIPTRVRVAMPRVTEQCGQGLPIDRRGLLHAASHVVFDRVTDSGFDTCAGGLQSAAIGEAVSDLLAAAYSDELHLLDLHSRPAPPLASAPAPRDYGALCSGRDCSPHPVGRLLSAPLWGLGRRLGEQATVELAATALAFLPCAASLADARDALFLADALGGGRRRCVIAAALAPFALGFEAEGGDSAWAHGDSSSDPTCAHRAHPAIATYKLREEAGSAADGWLGRGETLELFLTLENRLGAIDAATVSAHITTPSEGVEVLSAEQDFPPIPPGERATNPEPLRLRLERAFVCGRPVDLEVTLTWGNRHARKERLTIDQGHAAASEPLYRLDFEANELVWLEGAARVIDHGPARSGRASLLLDAGCFGDRSSAGDEEAACDGNCSFFETGLIRLPADRLATLTLFASYRLEPLRDGVWIEVTRDDGATWEPLAAGAYPSEVLFSDEPGTCYRPRGVRGALSGPALAAERGGFEPLALDLAAFTGETIRLRLLSHHDRSVYLDGTYIDDIAITAERCAGE